MAWPTNGLLASRLSFLQPVFHVDAQVIFPFANPALSVHSAKDKRVFLQFDGFFEPIICDMAPHDGQQWFSNFSINQNSYNIH